MRKGLGTKVTPMCSSSVLLWEVWVQPPLLSLAYHQQPEEKNCFEESMQYIKRNYIIHTLRKKESCCDNINTEQHDVKEEKKKTKTNKQNGEISSS